MKASAILLSVALAAITAAQNPIPKVWQQTYADLSQTIVKKDVKGFMSMLDKKFLNYQGGRLTGYAAYQKGLEEFLKPFSNIKAEAVPKTLVTDRKGNVVITFHYTFSGDYEKDGKKQTLSFFQDGVDTWRRSNGRYLQVSEKITKEGIIPETKASASDSR